MIRKFRITIRIISIHAPLAGCDIPSDFVIGAFVQISIHAPLAGCDLQHRSID